MNPTPASTADQEAFLLQVFEMGAAFHFMFPVLLCSPNGWLWLMVFYSDEEASSGTEPVTLSQGETND